MQKRILVTGGAGYIGSHTALQLIEAGHDVVVLDNLYAGHEWAVPKPARFYEGNISDRTLVQKIIRDHAIGSVIHFAGYTVVPDSMVNPAKYYANNVLGSLNLIETCIHQGVRQFVFSSSAAVYGNPQRVPVSETMHPRPINPYGTTKLMTEWTLRDLARAASGGFSFVALRYFNVAGAHPRGRLGQATPEATHLIKVACQTACGSRPSLTVYGDDYATPDGTCIRDYIHVEDLAAAHLLALDYLDHGGASQVLNCGYGQGFSVREVIDCVKEVSGVDFKVAIGPRRAGDPPELIADNTRIKHLLGWKPRYDDLATICKSAFLWEKKGVAFGR
ncbi:MAG: UDP-glucose 4-epimerase GalE [Gammaproteobacteria bacterium]|nr:UDP-glucose 4-epimerase GalE [Gammaproteobacteria bacterium]